MCDVYTIVYTISYTIQFVIQYNVYTIVYTIQIDVYTISLSDNSVVMFIHFWHDSLAEWGPKVEWGSLQQ